MSFPIISVYDHALTLRQHDSEKDWIDEWLLSLCSIHPQISFYFSSFPDFYDCVGISTLALVSIASSRLQKLVTVLYEVKKFNPGLP